MPRSLVAIRPCVACGRTDRSPELTLGEYEIFRCRCGVRTLSPEPSTESLVDVFTDGEIYGGALDLERELLSQSHHTMHALEKFVKPGRLLDVGFGPGFLMRAARSRGWQAEGVDPSPFSVSRVRKQGFNAHQGLLEDLQLPEASYDAVALMQVIEHVLDPASLLSECRRLLKPGGAIVVGTPNPASWLARAKREGFNYWIPPVHCTWYTPRALESTLEKHGLSPVRVWTWSARTDGLHDGLDILAAKRWGRRIPRPLRKAAGAVVASAADFCGAGSIVEAIALRWEDA